MIRKVVNAAIALTGIFGSMPASAADLTVETSEPGAVISIAGDTRDEAKELGKTPLTLKDYPATVAGKVLLIEKNGYSPVYLPLSGSLNQDYRVRVKLHQIRDWAATDIQAQAVQIAEPLVDDIVQAQLLLDQKKLDQASTLIDRLIVSYPSSVSIAVLRANYYLLSGKPEKAAAAYAELLPKIPSSRPQLRESVEAVHKRLRSPVSPSREGDR